MESQQVVSNYTGSKVTKDKVAGQILKRWGVEMLKQYNPYVNCLPYNKWIEQGMKVKHGEKSLQSYIIISYRDVRGQIIKKQKIVNLFYFNQVVKIK